MKKTPALRVTEGFSLVEILVVVTIIALLASIAAVSYSQFVKQARDAKRKTDIEQIRAAIELYRNFDSVGAYPASLDFSGVGTVEDANATYLSKVPNDPKSSQGYTLYYTSVSPFTDYSLCAYLENGSTTAVGGTLCGPSSLLCNYCMGPYGQK